MDIKVGDVEWNTICRVCLQEGEMTSIHIKDERNMTIKDKIVLCSSIQVCCIMIIYLC